MNEVQKFNFNGKDLTTINKDGDVWFVGKEVADILGYQNTRDALRKHVDDEDKNTVAIRDGIGNPNKTAINESGLYSLVLSSKLPEAKKFKRWVTSEVLPTIRKHGAYMTEATLEKAIKSPDFLIKLATQLKEEKQLRLEAENKVEELTPKAKYTDKILKCKDLLPVTLIAADYGMTPQGMNKLLHKLGVIKRIRGTWVLRSKYKESGWMASNTHEYKHRNGTTGVSYQGLWTQKGRFGLYELLKKHDILPVMERTQQMELIK